MRPTGEWLNRPGGLSERLQSLRKAAGLTGDQIARQLGWPRSKVPKLENGRQMPSEVDITAWCAACGNPEAVSGLLEMLSQAQVVHHQWRHRLRHGHPSVQADFDALVRGARHVRGFEVALIPGLLQTADYARARALEATRLHGAAPEQVEATVTARIRRQEALYDGDRTFEFIITEAALQLLLCPRPVMLAQLDRLLSIGGLANVAVSVIPFGPELAVTPIVGFLIADEVTVVETFTSADTLRGEESAAYGRIFDALMAEAVTGHEAAALIHRAIAALRDVPGSR